MIELTEKQIAYREWYQKNRAKVLEGKKAKYQPKARKPRAVKVKAKPTESAPAPTQPETKAVETQAGETKTTTRKFSLALASFVDHSERAPSPVLRVDVDDERVQVRRRIEDIKLARELGLDLEDLA
ncbi:hypothetical protein [Shewanella acanthi]|uniref:hypothetical protein n=1 Tax=Shewanella acanthi TaxID=2864212 RepID=UPI001C655079|nr:hypothetical protein [Shewanella acanthi]QYJ79395.1 hypothetical protein K0H61_02805 [Shewanella acanthi]